MSESGKQEEMFPEIARRAKEDVITVRRKGHKKVKDIIDMRRLAKYKEAEAKEQKSFKFKKIRKETIESDPKKNPNWINLESDNIRP